MAAYQIKEEQLGHAGLPGTNALVGILGKAS